MTSAGTPTPRAATADTLEQFFTEIGRYPLLRPAQEVQLARLAEGGDRDAREQLITSNLRLVVFVAKRFRGSVPLIDLIQEGILGLIHAVDRYDWRRGYRFSTYATWWIRQAVQRGIERHASAIRLPSHVCVRLREIVAVELQLVTELQREPTEEEVARALGLTLDELADLREAARRTPVSLDEELDETGSRIDSVAVELSTADDLADRADRIAVQRAVERLPRPERQVIMLRFGIDGGPSRPIPEVGELLGVSTAVVRRLERVALRRLLWSPELVGA